jgi:uncharacterized protein CbrC (UPF0167 family)
MHPTRSATSVPPAPVPPPSDPYLRRRPRPLGTPSLVIEQLECYGCGGHRYLEDELTHVERACPECRGGGSFEVRAVTLRGELWGVMRPADDYPSVLPEGSLICQWADENAARAGEVIHTEDATVTYWWHCIVLRECGIDTTGARR